MDRPGGTPCVRTHHVNGGRIENIFKNKYIDVNKLLVVAIYYTIMVIILIFLLQIVH